MTAICLHENEYFRLMRSPRYQFLEGVKYPKGAVAVPVFPNGDILLVRLERVPRFGSSLEFPRGGVERGEPASLGAVRELAEETGYQADVKMATYLGEFGADTGILNTTLEAYLIKLQDNTPQLAFDENEIIEPVRLSQEMFLQKVLNGEIRDGITLAAWALAKMRA